MSVAFDSFIRSRAQWSLWVVHVVVRLVPILFLLTVSLYWWGRSAPDAPGLEIFVGVVTLLIPFLPAGIWATVDGYRYNETKIVTILWVVIAAAVAIIPKIYLYGLMILTSSTSPTLGEFVAALLSIVPSMMVMVISASALVLLGAWTYRCRNVGKASDS